MYKSSQCDARLSAEAIQPATKQQCAERGDLLFEVDRQQAYLVSQKLFEALVRELKENNLFCLLYNLSTLLWVPFILYEGGDGLFVKGEVCGLDNAFQLVFLCFHSSLAKAKPCAGSAENSDG